MFNWLKVWWIKRTKGSRIDLGLHLFGAFTIVAIGPSILGISTLWALTLALTAVFFKDIVLDLLLDVGVFDKWDIIYGIIGALIGLVF
jgi:hypothetical protein